jgi:hypothetical protein
MLAPYFEEKDENMKKRREKKKKREKWVVVIDTTGEGNNISSVLKVPRHCPFVLLVSVSF